MVLPFLKALMCVFHDPAEILGREMSLASASIGLSTYAFASLGASFVASTDFPYLPMASTSDLHTPQVVASAVEVDACRYYNQSTAYNVNDITSCCAATGEESTVDVHACRNSSFVSGTFLLDPGCQTTLMKTRFNKFMKSVQDSNLYVSGFDNSTQQGDKHGSASMYFLQTDRGLQPSTDQGVDAFTYDTVDELNSNLFAVSDYYEAGADIHLCHDGFSGVTGVNPETNQPFSIPCIYSPEHRGWLVHFVVANSSEEAQIHGQHIEKSIRRRSRRLNDSLTDSQLLAALAITRGDIFIRDEEEYMDLSLGNWNDDLDGSIKDSFAQAFNLNEAAAARVCWAFPTRCNKEYTVSDNNVNDERGKGDEALIDFDDLNDECLPCAESDDDEQLEPSEEMNQMIDEYYKQHDASITGIKASLDSRHRKMDNLTLHINSGCMGYHPECVICRSLKRNLKRRYSRMEPHKETRVGHTWGFDLLTSKEVSLLGNKYCMVMRDYKSCYFKVKMLRTKDQVTAAMKTSIQELRADPRFKLPDGCGYQLVSELRCDPAGEQRDDNKEWLEMCTEMECRTVWSDPTDKRSDGFAEQAVKMIELSGKSIMAANATPSSWWEPCYSQGAEIRNHVPITKNVISGDGDSITPIEELSWGKVSRRMCHRYMNHLVTCGTPCHVSQKPEATAGSDNTVLCRHKPGIAFEMIGDMPSFKSPVSGSIFRSKSYVAYDAPRGISAYEFLGYENPSPLPYLGITKATETEPQLIMSFNDIGEYHSEAIPAKVRKPKLRSQGELSPAITITDEIGYIYETDETGEYKRTSGLIQKLEEADIVTKGEHLSHREREIALLKYDPNAFIHRTVYQPFNDTVYEGIVRYCDKDSKTGRTFWNVLYSDGKSGDLWGDEMVLWCIDYDAGQNPGPLSIKRSHPLLQLSDESTTSTTTSMHVRRPESFMNSEVFGDESTILVGETSYMIDSDIVKQRLSLHDHYYTSHGDTFKDVCIATKLDKAQWPMYYSWVHENFMRGETFLKRDDDDNFVYPDAVGFQNPFEKGTRRKPLKDNIRFPMPQGPLWEAKKQQHSQRSNDLNLEHYNAKQEKRMMQSAAVQAVYDTSKHRRTESQSAIYCNISTALRVKTCAAAGMIDSAVTLKAPKNFEEAMSLDNWDDWCYVTCSELDGMDEMDVFSKEEFTREDLIRMGIKHAPMPCGLIYDIKRNPDNSWDKDKARLVLKGHPWNMKKSFGHDYVYETYAATPDLTTTRLMQALMIKLGWTAIAFDIKMAYINADIPDDEQVPVQFEKALRRYNENGDELFKILRKCLYGSPTASRRFTQMRDSWMKEHFNTAGWTCKQITNDKSMFKFVSPEGNITLATVHSDDVDMICQHPQDGVAISDAFNTRFGGKGDGIKMCDPGFMLGVQRTVTTDPETGVVYLELTQSGCITDLYEEFEDQVPKRPVTTPMPDKTFLSMYEPDGTRREQSDEVTAAIKKAGYMHIVGTLLWLSRNCYPEISQGLSQLCSVMSQPTQVAFDAALHMIKYVYSQKDRGIRFNSDGNFDPLCLYDASNKGDYGDSKVSAGYVIMFAGGPISWSSKKAQHVGASSSHNEYMAAFHAAKESKWIRDLLIELDLPGNDWTKPIVMLGDNDQATRWVIHGMVTTANKSVRMNYHWVQEACEEGFVDPRRVPTDDNTSDVFTKTLGYDVVKRLRPGLTGYGPLPTIPESMPF
jgi:hypothetical protein